MQYFCIHKALIRNIFKIKTILNTKWLQKINNELRIKNERSRGAEKEIRKHAPSNLKLIVQINANKQWYYLK